MVARKSVSTGSPFEPVIGFSRAVRIGNFISVSGTAPLGPDGKTVGVAEPGVQARRCFEISFRAIEELGGKPQNIIRTRVFLRHINDWQAVAKVHGEFFRDIRPASTMFQIDRFIDPDWLVETEMDAIVDES